MRHENRSRLFDRLSGTHEKNRQRAVFDMLFGIDTKAKSSDECTWRTIAGHRVCFRKNGKAENLPEFLQGKPAGKQQQESERAALRVAPAAAAESEEKQPETPNVKEPPVRTAEDAEKLQKRYLDSLPDGWSYDESLQTLVDDDMNEYFLSDDSEDNVQIIEDAIRNAEIDPQKVLLEGDLRKVGASFLDDVEPDESGSLVQAGTERSYVRIMDQDIEDWDAVPYEVQTDVEDAIADQIATEVANDEQFVYFLRQEVRDLFDEEFDEQAFLDEMVQSNVDDGMSLDEAEKFTREAYDNGDKWIVDAKEEKREAFLDEKMDGSYADQRTNEEIESRIDAMDNDDRLEYALQNRFLDDIAKPVETALDDIGIDEDDIATMFGVGDEFEFTVEKWEDDGKTGVEIIWNESTSIAGGTIDRAIYRDSNGDIVVKHESFRAPSDAEPGFGLQVFSRSVGAYRNLGFGRIETYAAGGAGGSRSRWGNFNGYYTWPLFGFDQDLSTLSSDTVREAAYRDWPDASSVLDIIQSEGGREWWKKNGGGTKNMVFDLSSGSRSMQQLEAYIRERKARRVKAQKAIDDYEGGAQ